MADYEDDPLFYARGASEPKLADVLMQRNALDAKPFWGDTQWRGPSGLDYIPLPAKNSQMADFLLTSMMGLGALRPRAPLAMRDRMIARSIENKLDRMEESGNPSWDRGITGGTDPNSPYVVPRSAEALVRNYGLPNAKDAVPHNLIPFGIRRPANEPLPDMITPRPNWQDTASRVRPAHDPDWTNYGYPISRFPPSKWRGDND